MIWQAEWVARYSSESDFELLLPSLGLAVVLIAMTALLLRRRWSRPTGEAILAGRWRTYLEELRKAEERAIRVLPTAWKNEARALDALMSSVQSEARRKGDVSATPVETVASFKREIDRMSDAAMAESRGVSAAVRPLTEAGFTTRRLEPALAALRSALAGWTDERFAALFQAYLRTAFPARDVLKGLQTAMELPQIGEQFRIAKDIVDTLLAFRRRRGYRDLIGEDVLVATTVDYASAVWLRRRLEAVLEFIAMERQRGSRVSGEVIGDDVADEVDEEQLANAPILRWLNPRVFVDQQGNLMTHHLEVGYRIDGLEESWIEVIRATARIRGWGMMTIENLLPGQRLDVSPSGARLNALRSYLDHWLDWTKGSLAPGGYTRISWSLEYVDTRGISYLTTASVEVDLQGVGEATILRETLDESDAIYRHRRHVGSGRPERIL